VSEFGNKLNNFIDIVEKLRSNKGCPWDREQTPVSLKRYLMEETQELLEAIDSQNHEHVKEELGDILYLIVLLTRLYHEKSIFDMGDVIDEISTKMVRRHPHVFEDEYSGRPEELRKNWLKIKEQEKLTKNNT
jgi:MazG family protein